MRHGFARAVVWFAATLAVACARTPIPVYVAPSSDTIESHTEMTLSGDGQEIFVRNHSSVAIIVTGLRLLDCENIRNRCEVQRLQVRVPPGQRVTLTTVRPNDSSRPSSSNSGSLGNPPVTDNVRLKLKARRTLNDTFSS